MEAEESARTTVRLSKPVRDRLQEIMDQIPGVHSLGDAVAWAVDRACLQAKKEGKMVDRFNDW